MRTLTWIVFIILTVFIGLYPYTYFVFDMSAGFPSIKSPELLQSKMWNAGFYLHISFGGVALLTGFSQFSKRLRTRMVKLHRALGKIYLISIAISGVAALYIAMFATGGLISILGFGTCAVVWMFTSLRAYLAIRKGNVERHQQWVIRSYAVCWAAVTLRLWAPLLEFGFDLEFMTAYRAVSWLSWAPNLLVAEVIVQNLKAKKSRVLDHVSA